VAELAGGTQTDARKKLQFTSSSPEIATSTWVDVGNAASSTEWTYFDCDTGTTVCNDGVAMSANALTSSTVVGWWNTTQIVTASTTMDHASTTVRELEFPIQSNGAMGNTTYYFRMFDIDQNSPVWRKQTSFPATSCAGNTACSYPRLTTATPAVLTQENYHWYANADSITPGGSLANENTTSTGVADGTIVRLRMNVGATSAAYPAGNIFKLKYATSTGGPWFDVGLQASTTEWIGYDNTNSTTTDGLTIVTTQLSLSTVGETYEEENPSAVTPNAISASGYGEWDWVLKANGVQPSIYYFFKMVKGSDADIDVYTRYPALQTSAATLSISGTCTQWDMSTACSGDTVAVAVNGSLQAQTGANGATWTISGLTQPTAGDVLTVFVSSTTAGNRAIAITKYTSGTTLPGVSLIQRTLVIGGGSTAQTITNASSSVYDSSASGNPNIFFDVSGANNDLAVDIAGFSDERLLVRSGHTYQPNPTGAQAVITTANFYASSTATVTANGSIWRLGGGFVNNGTFTAGTSTVEFSGSSASIDCASCTFYNLTASSTATVTLTTTSTVSNILQVEGTLSINSGRMLTANGTITLNGIISGAGTLDIDDTSTGPGANGTLSSVVQYDASAADIANTTFDARDYGGRVDVYTSSATNRVLNLAAGNYNFNGGLNIIAGGTASTTLQATTTNPTISIIGDLDFTGTGTGQETIRSGTGAWSVTGNADFTGGSYIATAGNTLRLIGDTVGTLTMTTSTLQNLEVSASAAKTFAANATTTIAGNFTITSTSTAPVFTNTTILMSSTSAALDGGGMTLNNLTINPTSAGTITVQNTDVTVGGILNVAANDTLSIAPSRTLTHSGATLTLPATATISGTGRLTYQSATAFPTTGNASSTVRFDATNNAQTMSARNYGGNVEIFNSGTTNQTVTMGATNHVISGSLDVQSTGTGTITLNGATNSASSSIAGSVTFTGVGGTRTITTGASANIWTVSGNVNLTGGTYTAGAGNTLKLTGSSPTLTTNGQTFANLDFTGSTGSPSISGNATSTGNVTLVSGMTLTDVTLKMTGQNKTLVGANNTLPNLTIDGTAASTTIATSDFIVSGILTLGTDDILTIASGRILTAQGTVVLPAGGTITGTGTLVYSGSADFSTTGTLSPTTMRFDATANDQNVPNRTFGGAVEVENTGSSVRNVVLGTGAGQTITFAGLTLKSTGSGGVTLTGATNNPRVSLSNFAVTASANAKNYTTGSGTTTISGNFNLSNIDTFTASAGHTLVMNGSSPTLTTNGKTFENIDVSGATTPIVSGNLTASGNVILASNTNLGTITITMTGQNKNLTAAGNTIPNLTIDGTTASTTIATSDAIVSGTLTLGADDILNIASSRTLTAQGTVTLPDGGTIMGAGTLKYTSATTFPTTGTVSAPVTFDMTTSAQTIPQRTFSGAVIIENSGTSARIGTLGTATSQTITFGNLTIQSTGSGGTTVTGATYNPAISLVNLAITSSANSKVLTTGSGNWTVSGNFNLSNITTFTASAGNTLIMSGSGTLTSNSKTLGNVTLSGAITLADATHTIGGNLDMTNGTITPGASTITMSSTSASIVGGGAILNNLTIDPTSSGTITLNTSDLTVSGTLNVAADDTLSIASGRTLTHSGATLTLNSGSVISGDGRLTYQSINEFPNTGTVSSVLRFDSTNGAQIMSARTYGGAVELYSNSGLARTVMMTTGTYALNSTLNLNGAGGGTLTLNGATNNATGTIAGNVSYTAGGGSETITLSSAPWTLAGALDISGGSFTAPAGTLNLAGNYTNNGGTFTHNSGTVVLNGSSQQTLSGTFSGGSAFNNLTITNNSGSNPDTSPSVIFTATSTANVFTAITASTTIRFQASSTFAFTDINWNGQASTSRVALRSSASPATWLLNANPSGSQIVSYVDAKDSDASVGDTISAADGTNFNSGGNINWDFVISAPMVSSTDDDVFDFGGATTTVSDINIKSGTGSPGGRITSSSDIRVVIPGSFNAVWDATVASITCADGNACANISTTGVTYESGNKIAVINVLQNFLSSEWVQISGLKMGNFTAVNASTTVLGLRVDGPSDVVNDATDTRSKTIRGTLALQGHSLGQATNQFADSPGSLTGAVFFRYRAAPTGESMNMTTTTVSITQSSGFSSGNITNAKLFMDLNGNGSFDANEPQLGSVGTTIISNGSGTIVFGGSWQATTTRDIILQADVSNIQSGYNLTLALLSANTNANGSTTQAIVPPSGTVSSVNHARPNISFGGSGGAQGGGAQGGAPPESGGVGGGTPAGGGCPEGGCPTGGGVGGGTPAGGGGEAP